MDYELMAKKYPRDWGGRKELAQRAVEERSNLGSEGDSWDRMKLTSEWDDVDEAVKLLAREVNRHDPETLAKMIYVSLRVEHRTLQNLLFATMFRLMDIYKDSDYDLRNWASVVACDRITELVKEEGIVFPLV